MYLILLLTLKVYLMLDAVI